LVEMGLWIPIARKNSVSVCRSEKKLGVKSVTVPVLLLLENKRFKRVSMGSRKRMEWSGRVQGGC